VAQHDGTATLPVDDSGAGISPAEREHVFDRLYRRCLADESGDGLGLAIVRGVAKQHGAQVRLAEPALGGLRVTLSFGGGTVPARPAA